MSERTAAEPENPPLEIDVEAFARMRRERSPQVIDVREPWEVEICGFSEAELIPLGTLPQRVADIPRERDVIVVCHSGRRSLLAAKFLREHGVARASSLAGGVDAWASRIDPTMARY